MVACLLSLVKFAAHPGDTLAWRHLQMSPLQQYFVKEKLNRNSLPLVLLHELQTYGFQSFLSTWGARLDRFHTLDGFGRRRLSELISAAIEFDQTTSRDCNAFLRFIDSYQTHDLATDGAVRVMTIHQSKGLGFDTVVLPDLQSGNMDGGGQPGFALARDMADERPIWALQMPRRLIAQSDPVLSRQVEVGDETAAFDALCLLYVALTRARQGLYMITSFPGKTSRAMTHAAFLKEQLAGDPQSVEEKSAAVGSEDLVCLYETGDACWYARVREPVEASPYVEPVRFPPDFCQRPSSRQRLFHVQPSKRSDVQQRADSLFAPGIKDQLELGTAVHELMERVSWIDEVDVEELVRQWSQTTTLGGDLRSEATQRFRRAIAAPEIRQALSRPTGNVVLWREKRFEVVMGDRWVSGSFDRVVTIRDEMGRPERATVLDFKSDHVTGERETAAAAEQYRTQMMLYRSALSRMIGLDPTGIRLSVVFVNSGRVCNVG
ncbi:MAG: PD-(D/E)XK nuclease family protein [Chloroflexi bacterium]|nr:PD-(D/E)XK nuclease family protein [Chloroflexota bacterium]